MQLPNIKLPDRIERLPRQQKIQLLIIAVITVGLIPSILAANLISDMRSRADQRKNLVSCKKVDVDLSGINPNPALAASLVSQAQQVDRDLDREIKDYIKWDNKQSADISHPPLATFARTNELLVQKAYAASCRKNSDCNGDKVCKGGQCEKKNASPLVPSLLTPTIADPNGNKCEKDKDCKGDKVCKKGKCEKKKKNKGGGGNGNGGNNDNQRRKQMLDRIETLAEKRKELLIQLAYHDPSQVLNLSKGDKNREGYYVLQDNCKAVTASVTGEVGILHYDMRDKSAINEYILVTDNGDEVTLHSPTESLPLDPESRVSIQGLDIDDELILESSPQIATERNSQSSSNITVESRSHETTVQDRAKGTQHTLMVFGSYKDRQPSLAVQQSKGLIEQRIKDFYRESSYGKTNFQFNTTAWQRLSVQAPTDGQCKKRKLTQAMKEEIDRGINFSKYNHIVFYAEFENCPWAGLSTIGTYPMKSRDGKVRASIAWVDVTAPVTTSQDAADYIVETANHELGHGFGLNHAQSLTCVSSPLYLSLTDCKASEYGDRYSIMGSGYALLNARQREFLGWFSPNNIKTVSEGTYTLEPIETATEGLKALKIPRNDGDYVYVEYRQPIGTDVELSYIYQAFQGALLHVYGFVNNSDEDPFQPKKLDRRATAVVFANRGYAEVLPVGNTITDPQTGIIIQVKAAAPQGLTIQVFPQGSAPTATPTPLKYPSPTGKIKITIPPPPTYTPTPVATSSANPISSGSGIITN